MVRGGPVREEEQEEGKGIMAPPRKKAPHSTPRKRLQRASVMQATAVARNANVDNALIGAAGVEAQSVLIITRDHAGALRVWSSSSDTRENLRLAEFARGELSISALQGA